MIMPTLVSISLFNTTFSLSLPLPLPPPFLPFRLSPFFTIRRVRNFFLGACFLLPPLFRRDFLHEFLGVPVLFDPLFYLLYNIFSLVMSQQQTTEVNPVSVAIPYPLLPSSPFFFTFFPVFPDPCYTQDFGVPPPPLTSLLSECACELPTSSCLSSCVTISLLVSCPPVLDGDFFFLLSDGCQLRVF